MATEEFYICSHGNKSGEPTCGTCDRIRAAAYQEGYRAGWQARERGHDECWRGTISHDSPGGVEAGEGFGKADADEAIRLLEAALDGSCSGIPDFLARLKEKP